MNRLSKILLVIVIILTIALITMTILFFNMKNLAYTNFSMYETEKNFSNFLQEQLDNYQQEDLENSSSQE